MGGQGFGGQGERAKASGEGAREILRRCRSFAA